MKPSKSIIIITTLVFTVVGCGDDNGGVATTTGDSESYEPEVRLVKDGPHEFHFQWDEPLKEERIILCRDETFNSHVLSDNPVYHFKIDEQGNSVRVQIPISTTRLRLFYFPAGTFRSRLVRDYFIFVELLPARERAAFPLPNYAHNATAKYFERDTHLLKEHPFKSYRVGKPSLLTFDPPEHLNIPE